MKIKIIVAKDKEMMFEELERLADIEELKRKVFDRMMRNNRSIFVDRCKGRN